MKRKLSERDAVVKLRSRILREWNKRYPKKGKEFRDVSIYTWGRHGPRISEISFTVLPNGAGTLPGGGCSFMQSDTGVGIFEAERLLLEMMYFGEDEYLYWERLIEAMWPGGWVQCGTSTDIMKLQRKQLRRRTGWADDRNEPFMVLPIVLPRYK